jgi:hypothetical protein
MSAEEDREPISTVYLRAARPEGAVFLSSTFKPGPELSQPRGERMDVAARGVHGPPVEQDPVSPVSTLRRRLRRIPFVARLCVSFLLVGVVAPADLLRDINTVGHGTPRVVQTGFVNVGSWTAFRAGRR